MALMERVFLQIADKHAPLRLRKVKSEYTPWLTNEIKNMSYHGDFLKKKAVSLNSPAYHEAYKKCRNEVNSRIKVAKTNYYKTSLENIYLLIYFIYLLCFASKHHTIIALKKLGHHNSLTPITVGP
jgi:hypothetical protein